MTLTVKFSPAELDAALAYIESTGASDFFPRPFEFAAIRHSWEKVRPALERIEMLSYTPRACFEITAPKQRCLVRSVQMLDPIDTLLYTALAFRIAPAVEAKRATYQSGRVFSWRFDASCVGTERTFSSDWSAHKARLDVLTDFSEYVGTTDILDFFPRIYLHRLENSIAAVSNDVAATKALMRLVEGWSHGASYGIPTGPAASNLLAEALLIEVDEYLLSCDIQFVRWVDDYFIFGASESEVVAGLFRLGERLNQTQGLSLNPAKTRIRTNVEFMSSVVKRDDPLVELRPQILQAMFEEHNPYAAIDYDSLDDDVKAAIDSVDARAILEKALQEDLVDLKAVKFIITFLSAFRRPDLVDLILDNLPKLLPLGASVAKFFDALDEVETAPHAEIGRRILQYLNGDSFVPDFQSMWLLDPFTKSSSWNNLPELRKLARGAKNRFVRRQAILGLRQAGDRSALLDAKSALDERTDWEQRAIMYACSSLPRDECDAVVSQLGGTGGEWTADNCLRKAVLNYMKATYTSSS